mmetsp:Transcript_14386/g.37321  ORF Transcript_14386/g.37321 Transcript_14386/m.37321 type:complete len:463 (-) Transcript_14386:383-1771(-)
MGSTFLTLFKKLKHIFEPDMSSYDPAAKIDHSLLEKCKPHHREVVQLALTDLYGKRMEAILRLPAAWEKFVVNKMLQDERDLVLALTFLQIALWLTFTSCVQLFLLPQESGWSYLWFVPHVFMTWVVMGQRFILAMHYAAHRPLFSSKKLGAAAATILNGIPTTIMCNYYGMPAGAYYVHHCIMHHQANNFFPYDVSSTMPYNRGSPLHFVAYVLNFILHTFLYLPYYCVVKRRFDVGLACAALLTCYFFGIKALYAYNPLFFTISIGFSSLLGPFALMLGNFSQHIFVDPDSPKSNYTLACNHVNAPFNMLTFNDGYHITHHVSSICHWSEMPLHFINNLDKYEEGGAIIFKNINFDEVSFAVFAGEPGLRRLAKKVVQITPVHKSEDELVAMFRRRLRPIHTKETGLRSTQMGVFLANQALWIGAWACGWPVCKFPAAAVGIFHGIYHLAQLNWVTGGAA